MITWTARLAIAIGMNSVLLAQTTERVDFRRDVQPLFKKYCLDCHGPRQQMNGFRLDRRSDAMKGGTISVIGPGNSAASRLYLKLIGSGDYGPQMPPTGPLQPGQIQIIRAWIDQGADWPDELSGDVPEPPVDPKAARIIAALRNGDRANFRKLLIEDRSVVNRRGSGGATPLMYAALYGDVSAVTLLLKAGADPNLRNNAGASALMWALPDFEKTKLLLDSGADANAVSADARTPLLIASGWRDSSATIRLLFERGAKQPPRAPGTATSPFAEAAYIGELPSIRALIQGGVELWNTGDAVGLALWSRCSLCAVELVKGAEAPDLVSSLEMLARLGDEAGVKFLLDHGADAATVGIHKRTALMYAAASDTIPQGIVQTLIERGADVNAQSSTAESALQFARLRGDTSVVRRLLDAGASQANIPDVSAGEALSHASSPRAAIEKSLPLLQRADVNFLKKTGCVSCHNNSLTALTVSRARQKGIVVNEGIASTQLRSIASYLDSWRDRLLQNVGVPGDADGCGYLLLGLAAENYSPDLATDAAARFLASRQLSDGSWRIVEHRPPLESSDFEVTAVSMHALQVYAPKAQRARYDRSIQLAAAWLASAQPKTTEDRAFHLLGLHWSAADKSTTRKAALELDNLQRSDGGWAQLPTLPSDAYATGQALVSLVESHMISVDSLVFTRGVRFLLDKQLSDGSWRVKSRATPFQPYFDSGFPHEHDQWISDAATNWAAIALSSKVR